MTRVDVTGQPDMAKAYRDMARRQPVNGKGSSPRNCWSNTFRRNYDRIFRKRRNP